MEIFRLFGSILIDSSEANKSISKTTSNAEGLGSKLASGIKTAAKWAAGITTAAVAVGGAMLGAAKDAADSLGDIDDAAQRMKIDAESLQELEYVAKMSGLGLSDLEKAAKKLEGTDLNLDQAIDQIMSLGTAEEQTNMAIELFGENIAYNLQPMLNHGAEGIQAFKDQAQELGIVMSNEAVEAGADFGDSLEAVQSALSTLKTSLMTDFLPYVKEILDWIVEYLPVIRDAIKNLLDFIMPYVKPILDSVMKFVGAFFKLLSGDTDGFIEDIKSALKGLGKALFTIGKDIFTSLWDGIKEIWASIKNWVSEKVSWIADKLAFWRKSNDEMQADGSHASGLNYVPYDGYVAELHRGESVMNAGAMDRLMEKIDQIGYSGNNGPIELTLNIDGKQFARATYKNILDEGKRRGTSLVIG